METKDPEFIRVSELMQAKCADCHSPQMTKYPFYFSLPVAKQIIDRDIKEARSYLLISKEQLQGARSFNAVQLQKIKKVVEEGTMPPVKYLAMHWRAYLSESDKSLLLSYIDSVSPDNGLEPISAENPFHPDKDRVALGEKLFNDVRLSGDNTVSCASCHSLAKGGTDQHVTATGIHGQKGPINSPTVLNAAFNFAQFWDGRAMDLKAQAAGPINNPLEMGSNWSQVIVKLKADEHYPELFSRVYGANKINGETITDAIAEYEKSLLTPNSRFDKFLNGDEKALSGKEKRGYDLFVSNNCTTCHTGVNLGGLTYEKMGVERDYFKIRGGAFTEADAGRINVTKNVMDKSRFKVPTLRNVELTYPYFHDGSTTSLHEAVKTMSLVQNGKKLNDEQTDSIVAFLKTLTGDQIDKSSP